MQNQPLQKRLISINNWTSVTEKLAGPAIASLRTKFELQICFWLN